MKYLGRSVTPTYNNQTATELKVNHEQVRRTSIKLRTTTEASSTNKCELLMGYQLRIIDSSHLRATGCHPDFHHATNESPLLVEAIVVLKPKWMLTEGIFPNE